MSGTRGKKQGEPQGALWFGGVLDLLRFGALGVGVTLITLGVAAGLISIGAVGIGRVYSAVVAACILGSLVAGIFATKRRKSASLLVGLGVGAVIFLLLLTAGVVLYDSMPTLRSGGAIAGSCLCGGGLAGVLAGNPKKKRRK